MYSRTRDELSEMTDFSAFEDLCNLLLSRIGYEGLDPQGIQGRDGGKDSILRRDKTTVFHYSLRTDWESKLDEDLQTVQEHVEAGDFSCEHFVFVTNEFIGGEKKGKKKNEVEAEFPWTFELIDGLRIQKELDAHHLDLRKRFFGISDDGPETKLLDELESWRDQRIKKIKNNDGLSVNYEHTPTVILHIVPRSALVGANNIELGRDDELSPIKLNGWNAKPFKDGITGWAPNPDGTESRAYTDLYRDGRVEGVCKIEPFDRGDKELINPDYFQKHIFNSLNKYLRKLREKGIETPVYVSLSLQGIEGMGIGVGGFRGSVDEGQVFSTDPLTPEPVEVTSFESSVEDQLEDMVDEIWRDAGHWGRSV